MSILEKTDWDIFKGAMLKLLQDAFPSDTKIEWYEEDDEFGSAKLYIRTVRGFFMTRGYLKDDITALKLGVYPYAHSEAERIVNEFKEFERKQNA